MNKMLERGLLLDKRDRKILRAFLKARNKAEVARQFGLTRARVSQIVKSAQQEHAEG